MNNLEELGDVISTDVLIIGGGIAGIIAAIKAKEHAVDVLVVDKATVGWASKASKGHGILWLIAPGQNPDNFISHHVRNVGCYLNDQELFYEYAAESYKDLEWLAGLGVSITRDEHGKLAPFPHVFVNDCSAVAADLDLLLPLSAKARKMGAKVMNKVQLIDLLLSNGRVVGAVGFNILNGRFQIIRSRATILANGTCSYRVMRMWAPTAGEGISAAYRAGAEMRNAEFGNYYSLFRKSGSHARAEYPYVFNALGENITKRYAPGWQEDTLHLALGMQKEVNEGRGPIYVDLSERKTAPPKGIMNRPKFISWNKRLEDKALKYGPHSEKPEVIIGFVGELACIKVDHEMKTNLAGLWAAGDCSAVGSAWLGATSVGRVGGNGITNAMYSALRAGPSAAHYAAEVELCPVDYAEIKQLKEHILAPLQRDKGLSADDVLYSIHDVVAPMKYNLKRNKQRLEEAIDKTMEIQSKLPKLAAKDGHGLLKCHEVSSMALCAEMTFRAALMRTESRGWHIREDYPEQDDKNWLKWIIVKQKGGKMVTCTEPIPIDKYKYKPLG